MIDLQSRDILQINASILAGALIFLTFTSFSAPTQLEKLSKGISIIYGAGIIYAFSSASLVAMFGKKDRALLYTKFGFIYLIIGAVLFAVVTYYDVIFLPPRPSETPLTNQSK